MGFLNPYSGQTAEDRMGQAVGCAVSLALFLAVAVVWGIAALVL